MYAKSIFIIIHHRRSQLTFTFNISYLRCITCVVKLKIADRTREAFIVSYSVKITLNLLKTCVRKSRYSYIKCYNPALHMHNQINFQVQMEELLSQYN